MRTCVVDWVARVRVGVYLRGEEGDSGSSLCLMCNARLVVYELCGPPSCIQMMLRFKVEVYGPSPIFASNMMQESSGSWRAMGMLDFAFGSKDR
jgi:hypothetical protein